MPRLFLRESLVGGSLRAAGFGKLECLAAAAPRFTSWIKTLRILPEAAEELASILFLVAVGAVGADFLTATSLIVANASSKMRMPA